MNIRCYLALPLAYLAIGLIKIVDWMTYEDGD